jgi:hypothetical protein
MKKIKIEYGETYEWKMSKAEIAYMNYFITKKRRKNTKDYNIVDWLNK